MSNSKAFEEYVAQRCEEILETDDEHKRLNAQIISIETQLLQRLNPQNIELLQKLDALKERQAINDYCKIYIAGFNGRT